MNISQIKLLSLPVADQDRSKDFYVNILGFELVRDNPMGPDQRWVEVKPKNAQTSITFVSWFETMPAGSSKGLVLETSDLEADYITLQERGVKIQDGIQEQPWARYITFDDPDGNGIVLQTTSFNA